jgi:hypothetical protein
VAARPGCPECLTEGYQRDGTPMGIHPGYVARELDGLVDWRPCFGCNRDRWSAWQAGELSPDPAPEQAAHAPSGPTPKQAAALAAALYRPPAPIADNESAHERARKRAQLERLRERCPEQFQGIEP